MHRFLLVFAIAALVPELAYADIWRCRAPDGETHFTNVRPRGRAARGCRVAVRQREAGRRRANRPSRPRRHQGARGRDRRRQYDGYIEEAARLYQLPPALIRAVMRTESDYTPDAVSHAGASGLMQLMPRTAAAMGVRDPFDPRQNILGGTRYLRILANLFNGDLVLTVAAYNAGEGAVMRHGGVPPYAETRRYVRNVLRRYYEYRGQR